MNTEEYMAKRRKLIPANFLLNKFYCMGGFGALLNIIFAEIENNLNLPEETLSEIVTESESSPIKKQENDNKMEEDSSMDTSGGKTLKIEKIEIDKSSEKIKVEKTHSKGKSSKPLCPWILIEKILILFELLSSRLNENFLTQTLNELKERITKRVASTRDKEIRELDLDNVKKVFDRLENIAMKLDDPEQTTKIYEIKEKSELEFFFRFLDCQNFEKKLKGINGIREYASRIDIGQWTEDTIRAEKKVLNYFDGAKFVEWLLEKKVIQIIYEKYPHIELIKRSIDLLKIIIECEDSFPENLIDTIWNSTQDKHEDVLRVIYEKIIELGPELNIRAAQRMYSKFLTVKIEDYNEDFIDLICKFTKNCLRLVLKRDEEGFLQVRELPEDLKQYQFFGVPLMFDLVMDHTPLDTTLSHKVLFRLQEIITEFPSTNIFIPIVSSCLQNLIQDRSVYQSLVIMKRFLIEFKQTQGHTNIGEVYFSKLVEEHPLVEYLVNDICAYCEKVGEKLKVMRRVLARDGEEEEFKEESFVGKFPHGKNILERLEALTYFILYIYTKDSLTTEQVKRLWKVFVLEPNFTFETNKFLEVISKAYYVNKRISVLVRLENLKEVLLEILCKNTSFITDNFTLEKFHCLEFFFLGVNLFEHRISIEQKDENVEAMISSNYMFKVEPHLIGLDFIWKCLVECPEGFLVDRFINLLVNVYSRLDNKLKEQEQEKNQELIQYVMTEIARFLDEGNIKGIERYIQFLGKFFDRLENKRTIEYYRSFGNYPNISTMYPAHLQSHLHKITAQIEYFQYGIKKQHEFLKKERVGAVKEILARLFEVDSSEFDLYIDGEKISENDFFKDLRDIYEGVPNILKMRMIKKNPENNIQSPKYLITQNRKYIDIFFRLFSVIQPGKFFYFYKVFLSLYS